ncbi:uncharacterized protein SCHCODRAFT_02496281 [Schizophyllum commune H4-8]|uniref:Uncharacterized protein n=1 Tax=Schizophyllum commune (strain H4-8 / FGSC 9210) TaxID=578458 RepID=D8Q2R0_SCHCM|nr:uncharacterized protein SCHCODRAFT_02496281 [Schizophyllum commune H4-8]KAI5894564.1 hypothetical protein SCHCODRAFT_02496281 [Schizophyllum commune H4-8]
MTSPSNSWPRQLDIDVYRATNPAPEWPAHHGGGRANTENRPPTYATHATSAQHPIAPAGGSVDYSDLSWVNPFVFEQSLEGGVKENAQAPEQSHAASRSTTHDFTSTPLQPPVTPCGSAGAAVYRATPSSAQTLPQSFSAPSQADYAPPPDFLSDMTEEETDALFKSFSAVWPAPEVNPPSPVKQDTAYVTGVRQALYDRTIDAPQGMYTGQPSSAPNAKTQVPNALKTPASAYLRTFEEPRQHRVGPLTDASNTISNAAQKVFGWSPPQADDTTPVKQNTGHTAALLEAVYEQSSYPQQGVLATGNPNLSKANTQPSTARHSSTPGLQQRTFGESMQQRTFGESRRHRVDPASTPASTAFDWSPFGPATLRAQVDEVLRRKMQAPEVRQSAQAPEARQSAVRPLLTDVGNGIGQYVTPSLPVSTPALSRSFTFPPPSTGEFGSTSTGGLGSNSTTGLASIPPTGQPSISTTFPPPSNLEVIDETPEIVAYATKRKADFGQEGRGAVKQVRFLSPDRDEQPKADAAKAPQGTEARNISTPTEIPPSTSRTAAPPALTTSSTDSAAPRWTDSARKDGAWIIHLPRDMVFAAYPTHPMDLYLMRASDARERGCKILQLGQVLTAPQMDLPRWVEPPERKRADDARTESAAAGEVQVEPPAIAPTSTTPKSSEAQKPPTTRPARQRSASLSSLSSLSSDEDSETARPNGRPDKAHRYCPWQTSAGTRCGHDYWTDSNLAQGLSFRVALTRHTYPHRSAALGDACPTYLKLKGPRAIDLCHVKVRCGMWEEGAPAACGASVCFGDLIDHIYDVHYNAGQAA